MSGGAELRAAGVPSTIGPPQRAATVEPQLFRGAGVHHPDTVIDHGVAGDLTVRAASVRGTWARYNGTARQDDYAMGCSADGLMMVLALADGLSNAEASHMGATLAVRTAVQQVVRQLDEGEDVPDLVGVVQSAAYQLQRAAEQMAEREGDDRDGGAALATTLLVAVMPTAADQHGELDVQLARVGDSNAWSVAQDGWWPLLPAKGAADGGLASSQVRALPAFTTDQVELARVTVGPDVTFVMATDGVTDPFAAAPDGDVAKGLATQLHPTLPTALEFARMIAFRGQSWDDDRTAIALRAG